MNHFMSSQEELIILPDAPPIPGLTFRAFRGEADYPIMTDLINEAYKADKIGVTVTLGEMSQWYGPRANFNPYFDVFFAEVFGVAIAFGSTSFYQEMDGTRVYLPQGRIMPVWRRKGIGRAMLHYNERRLRALAATHPSGEPRTFMSYAMDTAPGTEALLMSEGYQPVRHFFHMVRDTLQDITASPLPDGLEVRPALPEHYRQIWDAEQEAARDHWGFSPGSEDDYQMWLNEPLFDPGLWCIAWDGDQVAGQVRSFIAQEENETQHRLRGYTEYISVRRPWRNRGLARALIGLSLQAIKERGMTEAALRVDSENLSGALHLYESCGFHIAQRSTQYRKPMD